jgi:GAF domain-containing protein
VERARILLGTSGAAFSVVDETRVWNKAVTGSGVLESPLAGSLSAVTITGDGPLIVPDIWADDRFTSRPGLRFYAGYPIETRDGTRIGALSVIDSTPRAAETVDVVLLRELALAVQRELAFGAVPAGV